VCRFGKKLNITRWWFLPQYIPIKLSTFYFWVNSFRKYNTFSKAIRRRKWWFFLLREIIDFEDVVDLSRKGNTIIIFNENESFVFLFLIRTDGFRSENLHSSASWIRNQQRRLFELFVFKKQSKLRYIRRMMNPTEWVEFEWESTWRRKKKKKKPARINQWERSWKWEM